MDETGHDAPKRVTERARATLKQVGASRVAGTLFFLVAALAIARWAWVMPVAGSIERALYDWRLFTTAPIAVEQDPRIVLVSYDEETALAVGKRSPLDRGLVARTLARLDAMSPKAIGIDILLDQPQPEDGQLRTALAQLRTPTFMAFTTSASDPQRLDRGQEKYLREFLASVRSRSVRGADVMMVADGGDAIVRRWPQQRAGLPEHLVAAMAGNAGPSQAAFRSIDFLRPRNSVDSVFVEIPMLFFSEFPEAAAEMVKGRYILVGGTVGSEEEFETPISRFTGRNTSALELHAQMLAQRLDGRVPTPLPDWLLFIAAFIVVAAGALTGMLDLYGWKIIAAVGLQLALVGGGPFFLQAWGVDTLGLPAFGWGLGWILAFLAVGLAGRAVGSEQRRFAQSALGKYLPQDIANQIIRDPERLALTGEQREIYALFTDLEGFTALSHAITPRQLSTLLNRYLDLMSETVLRHGGTIDKFVGDAVVAFWGAPISRDDDARRAVDAAMAMGAAGDAFAREASPDLPPIGRTRVGLHFGEAVVGNFGGEGRIQYTALGDGMNTAARLESANKLLHTSVLVSSEAIERADRELFRPMGRVVLSGRAKPVEIWEPAPLMPASARAALREAWSGFDAGSPEALLRIEEVAADYPDDAALRFFMYRLRKAGPGGAYVLGSK